MALASRRPVAEKLGIKAGNRIAILYSPKGYTSIISDLPPQVTMTTRLAGESFDLIQAFYEDQRVLKSDLRKIRKALKPSGKVWICWKKGNVTNLSRDLIWKLGETVKLDSVASCAIDDEWSALKLMFPKSQRKGSE